MNNSFKISVKNGSNVISFELKNVVGDEITTNDVLLLSTEIVNELQNLNDTNTRLKSIGYKGNFFKFTLGRKCILSVEIVTELETLSLTKNLEFSFGKLSELRDPIEGLHIVLGGSINKRALISKL
jgi:hypothetical protein